MEIPFVLADAACRTAEHQVAEGRLVIGDEVREIATPVCVTCTEAQGYVRGLKAWREACPCCFSQAHPAGVPAVRPLSQEG